MSLETLRAFLLCSLGLAYALLVVWFGVFLAFHDALYRLHGRWFRLTPQAFDAIHYGGMAAVKLAALLLFAIPWLALGCVG
jgi:NO-binding membrane sensor protein with MHYT domain